MPPAGQALKTGPSRRVGFIGLGIMGRPMARHLLSAGHALTVWSRTPEKAAELLHGGARWADAPAGVAAACDVLMTCVTDGPDVEAVLFGADGALRGWAGPTPDGHPRTVVDFSTISPRAARRIAERLSQAGVELLDAPVTGGQIGAEQATLTIMAGGTAAAFERCRPLLECVGSRVVHVGPSGAGQMVKACNQVLCAVNMIGVCEALLLARRTGLDASAVLDVLAGGAGGSWALDKLGRKIVANDLKPAFMIRLMQKDLRAVLDAAEEAGVPLPGTALAIQLFRSAASLGGAELGTQAMMLAYEALAGRHDAG